MTLEKKVLDNDEPILISRWYVADVENALKQAGIETNEVNILKAVEEVRNHYLGCLVPYGNEILETMMANLFKENEKNTQKKQH